MMKIIEHTSFGPVEVTSCDYKAFPGMAFSNGLVAITIKKNRIGTMTTYVPLGYNDDPRGFIHGMASNCEFSFMKLVSVCLPHRVFQEYTLKLGPGVMVVAENA